MSTVSEHSKPFRFFDLPLELQRLILAKHYEEPWEMVTGYKSRPYYKSGLSRNPLLVSHRFSREAKLAIAESEGHLFDAEGYMFVTEDSMFGNGFDRSLCENLSEKHQCGDPAITDITVLIEAGLGDMGIRVIKDRFTNVTKFGFGNVVDLDFDESIVNVGLLAVLQGKMDSQIGSMARRAFWRSGLMPKHQPHLCGVTILFPTETNIGNIWSEPRFTENGLAEQEFFLDFELTGTKCRLVDKRLEGSIPSEEESIPALALADAIELLQAQDAEV